VIFIDWDVTYTKDLMKQANVDLYCCIGDMPTGMMLSPSSSPLRRRPRMDRFTWNRLIFHDDRHTYTNLKIVETPSVPILRMMLDMNGDDPDVRRSRESMERYLSLSGSCATTAEYEQKDYSDHGVVEYGGCVKIGRAYSKSYLQHMPSKLLNTVYKNTHVELDMRGSFSTMLFSAFKHLEIPAIEAYANDPDGIYDGMRREYGIGRDKVKKIVNSMICGHPSIPSDYGVGFSDMDLLRGLGECAFIGGLKKDLAAISAAIQEDYTGFYKFCSSYNRAKNTDRVSGVAMSFLASDMEHAVMRFVIKKLYGDSAENVVWKFDGVLIHQEKIGGRTWADFERFVSNCVMEELGIRVVFKVKSLQENSLGISLSQQELADATGYAAWKVKFERSFFRLMDPPVFCQLFDDGVMLELNDSQFKHNTLEQPQEYLTTWKVDKSKRLYERKDFAPPPLVSKSNSYNMYRGLAAELLPSNDEPRDISIYKRHVDILMGNVNGDKPSLSEYFHKLIAQKIQKPGLKWRVMPFIRSTQGVGKDVWAAFISKIFGYNYVHKACAVGDVMGKSSAHQEGKLLVVFSEMSYADTSLHMEDLKDAITADYVVVKKKYVNEYKIRQTTDFIGFSNNFGAIQVDQGERRLFVVTSSGLYANDHEYFTPLLEWMGKQENQRAVYDFYMDMDVENFDSSAARPVTEDHKEMACSNRTTLDNFLMVSIPSWIRYAREVEGQDYQISEHGILRIKASIILDCFMQYAQEIKIQKCENKASMTQFIHRQMKELNAKTEKYLQPGSKEMLWNLKSNGVRYKRIDYVAWERYKESLSEDVDDVPDDEIDVHSGGASTATEIGVVVPPRIRGGGGPVGKKTGHWNPAKNPLFVIRQDGETIYETNTFDDLNRNLGEAYIDMRDGKYVLVSPFKKQEIELDEWFTRDENSMRRKVEAKYPWYVKDRTIQYK